MLAVYSTTILSLTPSECVCPLRLELQIKELEADHQEALSTLRSQHKSDLAALKQANSVLETQQAELQKEVGACTGVAWKVGVACGRDIHMYTMSTWCMHVNTHNTHVNTHMQCTHTHTHARTHTHTHTYCV